MDKKNKAEAVLKLLQKGYSAKDIQEQLSVSLSYVHMLKKKLAEGVGEVKEAAEEAVNETLHNITQGRQKYRGTMERKVPGGPATVVRATTEDRVERILDKRGTSYGTFLDNARITQRLKAVAHQFAGQNNKTFDADQAEALDLIFTKIGRILNGDPNHIDSWIDIAGYATLVADRLQGKIR